VNNKDANELLGRVRVEAERSRGAPMIFTLTSVCKEWLDTHNEEKSGALSPSSDAVSSAAFSGDGTPVTPENYALWWAAFLKEKADAAEGVITALEVGRKSGKLLFFEKGAPGLLTSQPSESSDETATGGSESVDWALFAEEDGVAEAPADDEEVDEDLALEFQELHEQGPVPDDNDS